jgi:hypothetical protein
MTRQPRYSKEENARRGTAIYEQLRTQLEPGNRDNVAAIDVDSGPYEIADGVLEASERLLARLPDAQILCAYRRARRLSLRRPCSAASAMITGVVNPELEAMIRVTVQGSGGKGLGWD